MRTPNEILNILKRGDLIFFTSKNYIAKIIQWATSSAINHVGIYLGDELILESQNDTGVSIREIQYYFNREGEVIQIGRVQNISEQDLEDIVLFAGENTGKRYDFFGLLGIFLKHIVKKLKLHRIITFYGENKINEQSSFWCSEFVGYVFLTKGIRFADHDISYLTPSEIFNSPIIKKIEENHANISNRN